MIRSRPSYEGRVVELKIPVFATTPGLILGDLVLFIALTKTPARDLANFKNPMKGLT